MTLRVVSDHFCYGQDPARTQLEGKILVDVHSESPSSGPQSWGARVGQVKAGMQQRMDLAYPRLSRVLETESAEAGCRGVAELLAARSRVWSDEAVRFREFCGMYGYLSRSQWCQDLFVMFMSRFTTGGVFIEAGAGNGITLSNTLSLERFLGWSGYLVEPEVSSFKSLVRTRSSGNSLVRAALSPYGDYASAKLRVKGQLSHLEKGADDVGRRTTKGPFAFRRPGWWREQRVSTVPLQEVLVRCGKVDYLSLDVEGPELEILRSVDWSRAPRPKVITVEYNGDAERARGLVDLLGGIGYLQHFGAEPWLTRGDLWFSSTD